MLVKECVDYLQGQGFKNVGTERAKTGNQFYFAHNGLLVGIHESLQFELDGKVNMIHFSALMKSAYEELDKFQRGCCLAGGFVPYLPEGMKVGDVVEWDMKISQHPMNGFSLFQRAVQEAMTFAQKNQRVSMWSEIYLESREWTV